MNARRVALGRAAPLLLTAALAMVPGAGAARAATLFGLVKTGELFSSTDNGATWTASATLPVGDAVALAARFSASELFLASASGVVYRSVDGGATWNATATIAASDVVDLVIRHNGAVLLLTASGTLYRSTDLGASFVALAALAGSDFVSLAANTAGNLYALARTGRVYQSTDGGAGWTARGAITVPDAARLRALGSNLFALTETGDVFRSADAGASWIPVGTISHVGMRGLASLGAALGAASREGHCWTSADGASWTVRGSINQLSLTALATDLPATTGVETEPPRSASWVGPPRPNPWPGAGPAFIPVRLEREEEVVLALYDLHGREVARLATGRLAAGSHDLQWDSGVDDPGLYFLRLRVGSKATGSRRWVVLR